MIVGAKPVSDAIALVAGRSAMIDAAEAGESLDLLSRIGFGVIEVSEEGVGSGFGLERGGNESL